MMSVPQNRTNGQQLAAQKAVQMLSRRFVFGTSIEVSGGLHYLDSRMIIWTCGKSLVMYDTQGGRQIHVPTSDHCERISSIAVSHNRRVVAIAEQAACPSIAIYVYDPAVPLAGLRYRKTLVVPDVGSMEYACLDFSADGKYLVSLGGYPEWTLVYWDVERGKMLARTPALVDVVNPPADPTLLSQCSISPQDATVVCVIGRLGILKLFDLADGQLLSTSIDVTSTGKTKVAAGFLAHVWLPQDGRLIISTDNGDLLLVEDGVYKYPIPMSPSDGLAIFAMAPHSKGFVCGGEMGTITIYERTDDKELYRKARTLRIDSNGNSRVGAALAGAGDNASDLPPPTVLTLTVSPPTTEEFLAFMTNDRQLYSFNLANVDFMRYDERIWEPVCQPFHSGPIVAVDVCVRKALAATAGKDRKIVLWNYVTHVVEGLKRFSSDIHCLAIHPSGLYLLVGFTDCLRFMNIYKDDIREFRSFSIRSCTACRFSVGGQYFAAAHSTIVHVYHTYTCEQLGHLRGHNSKIRSINFAINDDTRLITSGDDGAVLEFSLCDFHKTADHIMKAIKYHCAVAEERIVWGAGNDRRLRQFDRETLQQQAEYDLQSASMTSMAIGAQVRLLFGGCEDGTVRVFNTYLGEKQVTERDAVMSDIMMESYISHTGPITRMAVTHDESLLVTVGEDGLVMLWDITAPHRGDPVEATHASEVLLDRDELEAQLSTIRDLQAQVAELRQRIVQQQARRERTHEEHMQVLERGYGEERSRQQQQLEALASEKSEQAIRFSEFIAELDERQVREASRIQVDYDEKLQSLRVQEDFLRRRLQEQQENNAEKLRLVEAAAERDRVDEEEQERAVLAQLQQEIEQCTAEMGVNDVEVQLLFRIIEEDTDGEIVLAKESFQRRRREQEEELAVLQAANSALTTRENLTKADLEAKRSDTSEKLKQQAALEAQIEGLRRDIEALQTELRERAETSVEKDRRILELRRKNQELEKFKFVLDYKIRELKAQIDPREEEIRLAKAKLGDMDSEAERYFQSNESLVLQIRNWQHKLKGQRKDLLMLEEKLAESSEFQSRLWTGLSDLAAETNPKQLKAKGKMLFERYTDSKGGALVAPKVLSSRTATDELNDFNRGRDYLERNMNGLKRKLAKDTETSRSDKIRIVNENVILTREINDLRRDARALLVKAGLVDDVGKALLFQGDVLSATMPRVASHGGDDDARAATGNTDNTTGGSATRRAEIQNLQARLKTMDRQRQSIPNASSKTA